MNFPAVRTPLLAAALLLGLPILALPATVAGHAPGPGASPEPVPDGPAAAVQELFDAMARGDSAALRDLLLPGAQIAVPTRREGEWAVARSSTDEFIRSVVETRGLEERMRDPEVRVDGRMATVWAEYAFYLDGRLQHCGVDAFQLFRVDGRWRIQHVAYTRRIGTCEGWEDR